MKPFSELWNKARMFYFANMQLALFAVRTRKLREIANAFDGKFLHSNVPSDE